MAKRRITATVINAQKTNVIGHFIKLQINFIQGLSIEKSPSFRMALYNDFNCVDLTRQLLIAVDILKIIYNKIYKIDTFNLELMMTQKHKFGVTFEELEDASIEMLFK